MSIWGTVPIGRDHCGMRGDLEKNSEYIVTGIL